MSGVLGKPPGEPPQGQASERLVSVLDRLEAPNLTQAERFDSLIAFAELLYGFGFKQAALRELKFIANQYSSLESLHKLIESLDPTWIRAIPKNGQQQKETIAESDFDITVLDE